MIKLSYRITTSLPCDQSCFFILWPILFLYLVINPVSLFCDQSCFVIFLSILFLYLVTNPVSLFFFINPVSLSCDQSYFFILWSILFIYPGFTQKFGKWWKSCLKHLVIKKTCKLSSCILHILYTVHCTVSASLTLYPMMFFTSLLNLCHNYFIS